MSVSPLLPSSYNSKVHTQSIFIMSHIRSISVIPRNRSISELPWNRSIFFLQNNRSFSGFQCNRSIFVISYNRSIFVIPHSRCVFVISNDRSISTIRLNICIIYFLPTKQQIYFFTIHTTALFCTFELFLACQISYTFLPYHKIDLFSSFPTKHIILVILILATFSNPVTSSYEGDIWVSQKSNNRVAVILLKG